MRIFLDVFMLILLVLELPMITYLLVGQVQGRFPKPVFKPCHLLFVGVLILTVVDLSLVGFSWFGLVKLLTFLGFTYIAMSRADL